MNDETRALVPVPRVVLALDEAGAPDLVFDLGAILARLHTYPLVARIRANLALDAAAELPFVKEVDVSGVTREWTPHHAHRARLRASRQWLTRLQALGREYALETALEQAPDRPLEYVLGELHAHDVLVLGSARLCGAQVRTARIGAVCRDGGGDAPVMSAARTLAEKMQCALHVLIAREARAAPPDVAPPPAASRAPRTTREVTAASLTAILAAARAARIQVLVLSRRDLVPGGASLHEFLARPGRCVVLLP